MEKKISSSNEFSLDLCVNRRFLRFLFFLYGSVCKVNTQDPENFDEELKSLVTAWLTLILMAATIKKRKISRQDMS